MSVYEIFSSKQPHESSNLDAKLRKFLQRFIPAHLKDKPKEYVQKGKSLHSIRRIMRRYPNKEKIKQRLKEELMRGYRKRGRPPRQRRWTSVRRDEYLQEARDELRKELREELKNKSDKQATQSTSNDSPPQRTQSTSNDSPPPQQQKKKKQTKIVTPPPSPKTTEHNQPVVPPEEIEKAIKIELEEEDEEEEEDTERDIIEKMKELAKKRKFGKRAKNDEQRRHDDEIEAAREYLSGAPSLRRERKELNDYLLSEMAEDYIKEMEEDEVDPEEYLMRNMFIADDYD